ncbi:MAG TPA: pantetheine-phosphate adenylyltransferase [Beijerinckiaceae bacterium]|nr:pantetheine-phosphate adenylyltransferase [Beijerinckiaceae bacterium]
MHSAFYPGSFDPLTNGHMDVLKSTFALVDRLVVAVGIHPGKAPMFSAQERLEMIMACCGPMARAAKVKLEAITFDGLTVDAAKAHGCTILIRGLRDGTDLDYEMQLAGMNQIMAPQVQTVFLPASPLARPITATLVRQISAMGGDVSGFVPQEVLARLQAKKTSRR